MPVQSTRSHPLLLRRRLLIAAGVAAAAPAAAVLRPAVSALSDEADRRAADLAPDPARQEARAEARMTSGDRPAAGGEAANDRARRLSFVHTHTDERLSVVFAYGDRRVPEALASLDWLLRDFRNDAVHPIDPALFDQLHTLQQATGSRAAFEIISGYRSPQTNAMLHRRSDGVAARSLHLVGQAIDVRLGDVPLGHLRDAALSLRAGGVGFYPGSNFVHLDTGRVRRW